MTGVKRRLQRLFSSPEGRCVLVSLDHGVTDGMAPGLDDAPALLQAMADPAARAHGVVLNKGLARSLGELVPPEVMLWAQLSAGTRHGLPPYMTSLVCSAPEALRVGADGVCVRVNIGNEMEDRMLSDLGVATDEAHQLGLPVLAVIYARGGQIVNERDPALVSHAIRLGGELGADVVAAPFAGDAALYRRTVAASPAPVLVAGGPGRQDWNRFQEELREALALGAKGVLVGRNVIQHESPQTAVRQLLKIVHGDEDGGSAR